MTDLLGLVDLVSRGARSALAAKDLWDLYHAAQGDPQAQAYLRAHWHEHAAAVVQPLDDRMSRIGTYAAVTAQQLRERWQGGDLDLDVQPGEPPWAGCVRYLLGLRWGTVVILGPKGSGKTTLAMRLAQVWHGETGWTVEAVNVYPEDLLPGMEAVSAKAFAKRLRALAAYLSADDELEADEDFDLAILERMVNRLRRRIVIIDEASLMGTVLGKQSGRDLLRMVMAQARHLGWIVLYIGQFARQLPPDLFSCEAVFVKRPLGDEAALDRDDRPIQDLWERATEGFSELRRQGWRQLDPAFADVRSWAYVDARGFGHSARGYQGMIPFLVPWIEAEILREDDPRLIEGEIIREVA